MTKKKLATIGLFIFVVSIYLVVFLMFKNINNQQKSHVIYPTSTSTISTLIALTPATNSIPTPFPSPSPTQEPAYHRQIFYAEDCKFSNTDLGSYTMSDTESQSIQIQFINTTGRECSKTIEIYAPNFDIYPHDNKQTLTLQSNQTAAGIIWVLTPRKTGDFEIILSVSDGTILLLNISVTNFLGLNTFSVQLLSWIGTLFGPMLSVPWWYEKFKESKKAEKTSPSKKKKTG